MPDAFETLRPGEVRPFYASGTAETGTLTAQSGGTATLYNGAGAVVSGFPVSVTGQTSGAAATVEAWYTLTAPADPGLYFLVIRFPATGSDGISRTFQSEIAVTVPSVPEGTVRPGMRNLVRRVRDLVGDPVGACQAFRDDQVQEALDAFREEVRYQPLGYLEFPTYAPGGAITYLTFQAEVGDWEEDAALVSAGYAPLTPATANYQQGRWTFSAEPSYPVYLSGATYDVYGAAAALLRQYAGGQKGMFNFSPGDGQSFARGQKFSQPLQLAAEYEGRMRPRRAAQVRTDVAADPVSAYVRLLRR